MQSMNNWILSAALFAAWFAAPVSSQEAQVTEAQVTEAQVTEAQVTAAQVTAAAAKSTAKLSAEALAAFRGLAATEATLKGKRGPQRLLELEKLAAECEAVAVRFAAERGAAGRAWFEAGDAWRRHGSVDKAAAAFTKSLANDDGKYLERGRFELAQMQRRQKDYSAAVENYRRAAEVSPESNRAHSARVWIARCLDLQGESDAAMTAYRAALSGAKRPKQIVEASNWLAKALIQRGDLEAAAQAIRQAETAVGPSIGGDGGDAASESLQQALDKMSAKRALQRAKDRASGAARDAVELERDRQR